MVLTQAEKNRRKRERYLNSKAYAEKMRKREEKQKDVELSRKVRQEPCLVCGTNENLHCHHLIPREKKKYRWDENNCVSICANHHKFSLDISAHRSSALFIVLLERKKPDQFVWLQNHLDEFLENIKK